MRHFLSFTVAITLASLHISAAHAATAVGKADQLQGTATVLREGQRLALKTGDTISQDDEITTGPGSKLIVLFDDRTKLTLDANAEVVVDEFLYNPGGGENRAALNITAGAVRFVAGAIEDVGGAKAVNIRTPVATIGIRGTDFFVEMEPAHLSVALFSGYTVAVSNAAGTTVLHPGEGTDVFGAIAPTAARPWAAERIDRALGLTSVTPPTARPLPYARAAAAATSLNDALTHGVFAADLRLRSEFVDQASRVRSAEATTARLRLGYETLAYEGFYAGISGEITRALDRPRRNDGVNGRTDLPLIADPSAEVLHEAYAGWVDRDAEGLVRNRAVIGRQRLSYDNERWIGASEFRQNAQSFDGVSAETRILPDVALRYAYISQVNRILGNNVNGRWTSDSHLFGATTTALPYGVTTAYAYLLDLNPVPQFSSATYGVRYDGLATLASSVTGSIYATLEAEFARQTDYARNPRSYALTYSLLQPGLKWSDTTLSIGWEQLRGNGISAVQTPLATLHKQNGWADVFTVTPPRGLRDLHVRWLQELPDLGPLKMPKLDLRYLDFASADGGARVHYGHEWNGDINANVLGLFTLGFRAARYTADRFDTDTTKVWAYIEYRH